MAGANTNAAPGDEKSSHIPYLKTHTKFEKLRHNNMK
jgi:hypothetical protein